VRANGCDDYNVRVLHGHVDDNTVFPCASTHSESAAKHPDPTGFDIGMLVAHAVAFEPVE
jgi:hypothetical protein